MVRVFLVVLILHICCSSATFAEASITTGGAAAGKRIFLINSYHQGYDWSDGIVTGALDVLQDSGAEVEVFYMDTKRRNADHEIKVAVERALEALERYRPDIVIAADDNAQMHIVAPYLLDGEMPVVFCGVNWDASDYGYPASNVTGMIEVEMAETLVKHLSRFAKGKRIGLISDDAISERKTAAWYNKLFFDGAMQSWFCSSFREYQKSFLEAQEACDMLILLNNASMADWNDDQAERFILENVKVPTGAIGRHMARFALYTMLKMPEEQGEWAARTALRILAGTPPSEIPMVRNQDCGLVVNLRMAKALGIFIPVDILKAATRIIGREALGNGTTPSKGHGN